MELLETGEHAGGTGPGVFVKEVSLAKSAILRSSRLGLYSAPDGKP